MPRCDFLHCDYEGLCVAKDLDGARLLCPPHDNLVEKNGWTIVWERAGMKVFSPVMLRGREFEV